VTPVHDPPPPKPARRSGPRLTAANAAVLYRSGMSACEIGARWGVSAKQAAGWIRSEGVHGVSWCPLCRVHEVV
jgi:hypothetical protein